MIELIAAEVTVVVLVSAITGLVLLLSTAAVAWVFFTVFGDHEGNVHDVQRFVELTEQARTLLPAGLPFFDQEKAAATTAGIVRFAKKKERARQALWPSRVRHAQTAASGAPGAVFRTPERRLAPLPRRRAGRQPGLVSRAPMSFGARRRPSEEYEGD